MSFVSMVCRDTCSYTCLDARLYDDETLTVVLQGQEGGENKSRLLAQLPLGSAISSEEQFNWDTALRYHRPKTLKLLN